MNKENIPEIAEIDESNEKDIQDKLNSAKTQYPVWKGKNAGQTITGYVKEILTFKDLNGKDKHGILINLQTKNDKYPVVSIWANTVIESNLRRITKEKNFSSFETMTDSLKSNEGKMIAIRYEGEERSKANPRYTYENYTIVEI